MTAARGQALRRLPPHPVRTDRCRLRPLRRPRRTPREAAGRSGPGDCDCGRTAATPATAAVTALLVLARLAFGGLGTPLRPRCPRLRRLRSLRLPPRVFLNDIVDVVHVRGMLGRRAEGGARIVLRVAGCRPRSMSKAPAIRSSFGSKLMAMLYSVFEACKVRGASGSACTSPRRRRP